jgi:hypothetical protein
MFLGEDIHECEAPALDERVRNRLPAKFLEVGLIVEKLELAWSAGHEQVNDALGPGSMMARPRGERIAGANGGRSGPARAIAGTGLLARQDVAIARQERRQCGRTEAQAAINKKVAPRSLKKSAGKQFFGA